MEKKLIGRLKEEVQQCSSNKIIQEDEMLKEKLLQVSEILNGFASQAPDEEMLTKVISIQSLIKEIQKDVD